MTNLGDLLHLIGLYGYLVVFFGVMLEGAVARRDRPDRRWGTGPSWSLEDV